MNLLSKLKGGDLRSIGNANKIAKSIENNQSLFDDIFKGIFENDPIIRMRSADAIEKVSKKYPELLKKHKNKILNNLRNFEQQEVKWHIALMISYLKFSDSEAGKVFSALSKWVKTDESKIVVVNSMQALADVSIGNKNIKTKTVALIENKIKDGSPAIVSRGNKLLKKLKGGEK